MELKNANTNGCNVTIYILGFYFFQIIFKIELDKGLQSFILEGRFHNCPQLLKFLITFISLIKME